MFILAVLAGVTATAQTSSAYYVGDPNGPDLIASGGAVITFNTDALTFSGSSGAQPFNHTAANEGGVAVYRFKNVNIGAGVSINVIGSRPLAIAAHRDMFVGSSFTLNGSLPGRAGAGIGGQGGAGGSGRPGGSALGSGGAGGQARPGGPGGTSALANGQDGQNGVVGANAGGGSSGTAGQSGGQGGDGTFGFGTLGGPAGGTLGQGGTLGGVGGSVGIGSTAVGAGGSGGSGNAGDGDNGSAGTPAGAAGGTGGEATAGESGQNGGNGVNGTFSIPANTLDLFGGTGGSGGGGGGGGQGGGQGGGGGGGASGGSGGGGGAGEFGTADGGNGGASGKGGNGGRGGNGGSGGSGGTGGNGANGGGAIILSARGLLQVPNSTPMIVDVSCTSPTNGSGGTGGAGGAGGAIGGIGEPGLAGQPGEVVDLILFKLRGGNGGAGRNGSNAGAGGGGKNGGSGGSGGNGGSATPGMVKLHGSIVIANQMTINAGGAIDGTAVRNGKLSVISNMNSILTDFYEPSKITSTGTLQRGYTTNPAITGISAFTDDVHFPDTYNKHPFIPQLLNGPSPEGLLSSTYWNQATANASAPVQTLPDGAPAGSNRVVLKRLNSVGGNQLSPYNQFDQILVVNEATFLVSGLSLRVDNVLADPPASPRQINNNTGQLLPGQSWTTTVPYDAQVTLLQTAIITGQPNDLGVWPGEYAQFRVTASSATTIEYQWQRNTTGVFLNLEGEQSDTYEILSAQEALQGYYRVLLTNAAGEVISREAFLNVREAPIITQNPANVAAYPNLLASFNVEVLKPTDPSPGPGINPAIDFTIVSKGYQWQYAPQLEARTPQDAPPVAIPPDTDFVDIVGIPGITDAAAKEKQLVIPVLSQDHQGWYRVVVTNDTGFAVSQAASLNVFDGVQIIAQPESISAPPFSDVNFFCKVLGTLPIWYEWQISATGTGGWTDVTGSTVIPPGTVPSGDPPSFTLPLSLVNVTASAYYRCKVHNGGSVLGVNSDAAYLEIRDPGITTQPQSRTVNPGQTAQFSVGAGGTPTGLLNFTWYFYPADMDLATPPPPPSVCDGGVICPENIVYQGVGNSFANFVVAFAPPLGIGAQEANEGYYYVRIDGSQGHIESQVVYLRVNDPPLITSHPANAVVDEGGTITFSVTAVSNLQVNYQWRKNGVNMVNDGVRIFGATETAQPGTSTSVLQILSAELGDETNYTVVVTNLAGSSESNPARLLVGDPLEIIEVINPEIAYVNDDQIRFSVTTQGGRGVRTYQWYKDGIAPENAIGAPLETLADPFTAPLLLDNLTFSDAGTYKCSITDDRGTLWTEDLDFAVYQHLSQPIIGGDPEVERHVGEFYTFEVTLSGGVPPIHYLWQQDDLNSKAVIDVGGDSPTLTLNNLQVEDTGDYYVTVTDSGRVLNTETQEYEPESRTSNRIYLSVTVAVPALGGLGLALAAAGVALAGAFVARKRKR
jgi:hypothetical protein